MALAWALRDKRMSSTLIGASTPALVVENVKALDNLAFSDGELAEIDKLSADGGVNLWEKPSSDEAAD